MIEVGVSASQKKPPHPIVVVGAIAIALAGSSAMVLAATGILAYTFHYVGLGITMAFQKVGRLVAGL